MNSASPTCIVVLPTYNEAGNIQRLVSAILDLTENISVVVVDDNSPDGTGQIVKQMQDGNERVSLVQRMGKKGRGLAGKEGFIFALKQGAEHIVEMDADFSHDPAEIPALLDQIRSCDMVIGSRYIPGGMDERASFTRKAISLFARKFIRSFLGVRVNDPTSGFRCFSRKTLDAVGLDCLKAETPFIVLEVLYRVFKNNSDSA